MSELLGDKIAGALLGMAIGDAMGSPVSGLSPYQIYIKYQMIDGFYGCPKTGRGPGNYSGISQTALLVASTAASGELSAARIVASYRAVFDQSRAREWDSATSAAMLKVREGVGYDDCGDPLSVDGACLPRAITAGLLAAKGGLTDGEMSGISKTIINVTHKRKITRLCAFAFAWLVKELVRQIDEVPTPDLYEHDQSILARLMRLCQEAEGTFGDDEPEGDRLWMRLNFIRKQLQSRMPLVEFIGMTGNSPSCLDTLSVAIFSFMKKPGEFDALCKTATHGGPAGVTTAIVGALLGAYKGTPVLREDQMEGVENVSRIRVIAQDLASM